MQRIGEAEWMLDRARELKHLAVHLERLFGKTEVPQGQSEIAAMRHSGMLADPDAHMRRPLPVIVIALKSRLILLPSADKIAAVIERHAHEKQRLHPDAWVLQFLGVVDRLACELQREIHFAAHDAPSEVTPHHGELLVRLTDLVAKSPRALEDGSNFRRGRSHARRCRRFRAGSEPAVPADL
jgi:hypothetical protein